MSAIGTKRTSLVAPHMSAYDPKRTSFRLIDAVLAMSVMTTRRSFIVGPIALAVWRCSSTLAFGASGEPRRRDVALTSFNANSRAEIKIARGVVATVEADLIDIDLFNVTNSSTYAHVDSVPDFDLWRRRNVDGLMTGRITVLQQVQFLKERSPPLRIEFRVWDVMAGKQIVGGQRFVELDAWPPVAHQISEDTTSALR
jgi:Tol biopolymer transport system component